MIILQKRLFSIDEKVKEQLGHSAEAMEEYKTQFSDSVRKYIREVKEKAGLKPDQRLPEEEYLKVKAEAEGKVKDELLPKLMEKYPKVKVEDEGKKVTESWLKKNSGKFKKFAKSGRGKAILGVAAAVPVVGGAVAGGVALHKKNEKKKKNEAVRRAIVEGPIENYGNDNYQKETKSPILGLR